jgi:glycosyltransferase involved in cell wall biosynthesis
MARKKVVHIVEDLRIGGLERVIASICLGLDTTRYEVEVWCLARGGEIAEQLAHRGVTVKILGMNTYHDPLQIIALSGLIRRSRIDIIHTHGYFGSTFGRLGALLGRRPTIIAHVHTTYYGFKKRNLLMERFLSLFTDKIVCVSQAVRRFVVEVEGISEKKTSLIYNGVGEPSLFEVDSDDHVTRKFLGLEEKDIVVVAVASLTPHKGHQVLIDAARVVLKRHGNVRFLIVGDGPLRNRLESYTKEMGLSAKVVFAGQRKDIAPFLKLADLFVLPSTEREGLGIALIEAMVEGLPVIGTRLGGIPEVIEDNVNGLLVAPGSPHELAAALEGLIIDKALREKMGQMGRRIYEQRFTVARMNRSIETLYDGSPRT